MVRSLKKEQHHGFKLDIEPSVSISIIYIYCPHNIRQEHYTLVQSQLTNIIIRGSGWGEGGYKCQLSIKISAICQLSVKF